MTGVILACNAGSTNSKFAAFDADTFERKGHVALSDPAQIKEWLCSIGSLKILAIGHRIVHGGRCFTHPVQVTDETIKQLEAYIPLAPLHQPAALRLLQETRAFYPAIPHIACFDTGFHHTMPDIERRLPLPEWYHREGIQRYGFHGLSYEYIAGRLPHYAGKRAQGRVIVAHLGGGASACAMKGLQSVASTMGFSTLDGLMMGTRSGSIDPGVILYLQKDLDMRPEEVDRLLYLQSGLLGVSGFSADMRQLMASEKPEAKLAIELYCHQAAKQIASLLPATGGLDVLVFTGGIGENAPDIREKIAEQLRWAGNFQVYIIPTDEEAVIAKASRTILTKESIC